MQCYLCSLFNGGTYMYSYVHVHMHVQLYMYTYYSQQKSTNFKCMSYELAYYPYPRGQRYSTKFVCLSVCANFADCVR